MGGVYLYPAGQEPRLRPVRPRPSSWRLVRRAIKRGGHRRAQSRDHRHGAGERHERGPDPAGVLLLLRGGERGELLREAPGASGTGGASGAGALAAGTHGGYLVGLGDRGQHGHLVHAAGGAGAALHRLLRVRRRGTRALREGLAGPGLRLRLALGAPRHRGAGAGDGEITAGGGQRPGAPVQDGAAAIHRGRHRGGEEPLAALLVRCREMPRGTPGPQELSPGFQRAAAELSAASGARLGLKWGRCVQDGGGDGQGYENDASGPARHRPATGDVHEPVRAVVANDCELMALLQDGGRQEALSGFKDAINTGSARSWLVPAGILAYCLTDHRTGAVKRILKKHRRLFTTGVLFAFVLAWVVPAQACFASGGPGAQSECPGCAAPYACDSGHCGTSVHASCSASMAPTATVSPQSLDKFAQAPALLDRK